MVSAVQRYRLENASIELVSIATLRRDTVETTCVSICGLIFVDGKDIC